MTTNGTRHTIAEISQDVLVLIARLRKAETGATVSFDTLADMIGRKKDDGKFRGYLATARRRLQNDEKIIFGTVRGEGIKRLPPNVAAETAAASTTDSIRRRANRGVRTIRAAIGTGQLSKDEYSAATLRASYLGVVAEMTKPASVAKLEAKVSNNGGDAIASKKLLEAIKEVI